jgi:hypothetical protein
MDDQPSSELPSRAQALERCATHNLAVGPDGRCVICRREGPGEEAGRDEGSGEEATRAARPPWIPYAVAAACLGLSFVGGVALARGRAKAPVAEAPPTTAPVDSVPVELPTEPRSEVAADPPPAPHAAAPPPLPTWTPPDTPPRNYLDEAYAGMDRRGLYDNGRAPSAPAAAGTGTGCNACTRRPVYYGGYGGRPRTIMAPAVGTPVASRTGSR